MLFLKIFKLMYFIVSEVDAFMKDGINPTSMPNKAEINQGSLSDCKKYKLEIRTNDMRDMSHIEEGANVHITGIIKWGGTKDMEVPYLWIEKLENIELIKSTPHLDFFALIKGYKTLSRSLEEPIVVVSFINVLSFFSLVY